MTTAGNTQGKIRTIMIKELDTAPPSELHRIEKKPWVMGDRNQKFISITAAAKNLSCPICSVRG
mgnify:CR=1 FL=1|jgi:hypothetical protein